MSVPEWIKAHGISHPLQIKFLTAYTVVGMISKAAEAAGVDRHTHYDWLKNTPKYKGAWDEAYEIAGDLLEDEAYRRAVLGVAKPVFYQGVECGQVQEYSDAILALKLKGHFQKKYRDNVHQEHSVDADLGALLDAMKSKKPE